MNWGRLTGSQIAEEESSWQSSPEAGGVSAPPWESFLCLLLCSMLNQPQLKIVPSSLGQKRCWGGRREEEKAKQNELGQNTRASLNTV